MIFIIARFETKPDYSERWPELVAPLTAATRAEQGNLWFDWSRSLDNPAEYVLVEAFRDGDAGAAHVNSDHFKAAARDLTAGAGVHAAHHQPDHRCDWLVRDGGDEGQLTGFDSSWPHSQR